MGKLILTVLCIASAGCDLGSSKTKPEDNSCPALAGISNCETMVLQSSAHLLSPSTASTVCLWAARHNFSNSQVCPIAKACVEYGRKRHAKAKDYGAYCIVLLKHIDEGTLPPELQ